MKLLQGCFSLESTPTHLCRSTCCYVKQQAPKKQHEGRHAPLLFCVSKRMTKEALHVQITRAWTNLHVFSERNITTLENMPTPSLRSHLSSSPMGVFSRLRYYMYMYVCICTCVCCIVCCSMLRAGIDIAWYINWVLYAPPSTCTSTYMYGSYRRSGNFRGKNSSCFKFSSCDSWSLILGIAW